MIFLLIYRYITNRIVFKNNLPLISCYIIMIDEHYCNDLFSRFEQQTLILEKLAETTDPTTDRHGHDGPSRGSRSKILRILKIGY